MGAKSWTETSSRKIHKWKINIWKCAQCHMLLEEEERCMLNHVQVCDPMDCSPHDFSAHGIFHGKNTGVGCLFLLQGISSPQENEPMYLVSPALAGGFLTIVSSGKPSYIIRGFKIKTQWDTSTHLLEWPKSQILKTSSRDKDMEQQELSIIADRNEKCYRHFWKTVWHFLSKLICS